MERLTVLFDGDCPVCVESAAWLDRAEQIVPLTLEDCRSPAVRERFGSIPWLGAELVVVADDGRVWAGPVAFLVAGWALTRWRWLAELAMSGVLLPYALAVFAWVTEHRGELGWLVGKDCDDGHCLVKHEPAHATLGSPYR